MRGNEREKKGGDRLGKNRERVDEMGNKKVEMEGG